MGSFRLLDCVFWCLGICPYIREASETSHPIGCDLRADREKWHRDSLGAQSALRSEARGLIFEIGLLSVAASAESLEILCAVIP